MIKKFFFFSILTFLVGCTNKDIVYNDLYKNEAIGKVKTLKTFKYKADNVFGEVKDGKLDFCIIQNFDNIGNLLEMTIYNEDGKLEEKYTNTWDENGKLTESKKYDRGSLTTLTTYIYNNIGLLEKEEIFNNGKTFFGENRYEYEDSKISKFYSLDENKENRGFYLCYTYLNNNEYKVETIYEMTEKDATTSASTQASKMELVEASKRGEYYSIYKNEKLVELKAADLVKLEYDDKGVLLSTKGACLNFINDFELIGDDFNYYHEYDKHDNWIRKTEFFTKTGEAKSIFKREIEYY